MRPAYPSAKGWLTIFAAMLSTALAWVSGNREALVVAATLLAVLAVSWTTLSFRPRANRTEVTVRPSRMHAGDHASAHVELSAASETSAIEVTMAGRGRGAPGVVWSEGETSYRWDLGTPPRGELALGRCYGADTDLLGLFRTTYRLAPPSTVMVYPAVVDLDMSELPFHGSSPADPVVTASSAGGTEFKGLAEYRPGDDPRHIHWQTTSRVAVPMVKEFDSESPTVISLYCDLHTDDLDALERSVSAAASVGRSALLAGFVIRLVLSDGQDTGYLTGDEGQIAALRTLATASAQPEESQRLPFGTPGNGEIRVLCTSNTYPQLPRRGNLIVIETKKPASSQDGEHGASVDLNALAATWPELTRGLK